MIMKAIKVVLSSFSLLLVLGFLTSMTGSLDPQQKQPEPWPVPAEYKNMKNPVEANAQSLKLGEMLYKKNCASCHGKAGLGDGVKARTLETFSGDFSSEAFHNQTDGELFYKSKFGRDEMPSYEGKIPDEDIWHMVNYMRTFAK